MQSFQFRLDRVLAWRQKQQRMEENRLAVCLDALHSLERTIATFEAERLGIEQELLQRKAIPAAEFVNLGRYRLRAQKQQADFEEQRRRGRGAVNEQTTRVQKAEQRVLLLQKLRERRMAEYRYALDRELETVAAEAHMSRWSRGDAG